MSTRKPNHDGSNQSHSAKNEAPTASQVTVVAHCLIGFLACETSVCPLVINGSIVATNEPIPNPASSFSLGFY
jgi:hypothetical protein